MRSSDTVWQHSTIRKVHGAINLLPTVLNLYFVNDDSQCLIICWAEQYLFCRKPLKCGKSWQPSFCPHCTIIKRTKNVIWKWEMFFCWKLNKRQGEPFYNKFFFAMGRLNLRLVSLSIILLQKQIKMVCGGRILKRFQFLHFPSDTLGKTTFPPLIFAPLERVLLLCQNDNFN